MSTDVDAGRSGLNLGEGWARPWAVSWRAGGDDASCSVHDLVQEPVLTSDPMRHFTWRRDQRHRITPKMRRRSASVFLVRRAPGGGLDEAAQLLGISTPDRRIGYTRLLTRHLRTRGTARDFEQALDAITAELLAGPVIDYQRRREALASWTMAPENRQHMVTQVPVLTSRRKPISDDRRRLAVSSYIWTRVTDGEPDFAPCPPHIALDAELRAVWTRERHNVFHWLHKADHQPYYGASSHCSKTTPSNSPRRSTAPDFLLCLSPRPARR